LVLVAVSTQLQMSLPLLYPPLEVNIIMNDADESYSLHLISS
jgi:hypothetical protein